MLGLSSGLIKGASTLRSIVKSGLQAWYKADKTQAPLGEEKITNGTFGLGGELLDQPNFNISGTLTTSANPFRWYKVPHQAVPDPNFDASISDNQLTISVGPINRDGGTGRVFGFGDGSNILISGKTYAVTYTVVAANNAAGNFQIFTGNPGYQTVEQLGGSTEVGTHTVYFEWDQDANQSSQARSTLPILLNNGTTNGAFTASITISNLSLRRTNPTDSWIVVQDDYDNNSPDDVVEFQDGRAKIVYTTSGSTGAVGIKQSNILTPGKKYKARFTVTEVTPGSGHKVKVHATNETITQLGAGIQEFDFTPSGTGTNFTIHRNSSSQNCEVFISDVSIKEITNSVKDFSLNSNNANLHSGIALDFDGTSDYIRVLNNPVVSGTTLTAAFWIKPNTSNESAIVLSNGQSGVAGWYIWQDGTSIEVALNNASESTTKTTYASTNFYTHNVWQRVVVVIPPNGNISYYKDGELVEIEDIDYNWAPSRSTEHFVIGGYDNLSAVYAFDGQLADVQVYDKLWTASDVEFDYNNPDKDVFDDQNRSRVITNSLIPSIENSGFEAGFGNGTTWGAQQLNDGWNQGSGDAQLFSKSGDSITFGSISSTAQLYPPTSTDTLPNGVTTSNNTVIDGNAYVVKYTVLGKVGDPNLKIYTGTIGGYVAIPTDIGTHEFQFTHRGTTRASSPIRITINGTSITISNFSVHRVLTHEAQITEVDCKALYRLNEGAGNEVYNAVPALGPELVTGGNSNFESTNNWTAYDAPQNLGSNTSTLSVVTYINDKVLKITLNGNGNGEDSGAELPNAYIGIQAGKLYKVEADVWVDGNAPTDGWRFYLGGVTIPFSNMIGTISTNRTTFTTIVETTLAAPFKIFNTDVDDNTGSFFIDNVSIKEIRPTTSAVQASWVASNWITGQPYIPQYAMSSYSKKLLFERDTRLVGTLPTSMHNQAPNNFTLSIWYMPTSSTDENAPNNDRRTLFGLLRDLDANVNDTFTYQSFSLEHWEDQDSPSNGEDLYIWSGDGDTVTGDGAANNVNYKSIKIDSTFSSVPGKLRHYVITVDTSGNYTAYENGVEILSATQPGWLTSGSGSYGTVKNFVIGSRRNHSLNLAFEGFVDEISLFKKPLSETEIQEIFNAGTALDVRNHSRCLYELIDNRDVASSQSDDGYNEMTTNATQPDITVDSGGLRLTNHPEADTGTGAGGNANDGKMNVTMNEGPHLMVGVKYTVSYDVVENNDGAVLQVWKGNGYITVPNGSVVGPVSYTFTPTAITSTGFFFKQASQGKSIVINNISLKAHFLSGYWRNNGGIQNWIDLSTYANDAVITSSTPNDIQFQEVPLFGKDTLGFHMNKPRLQALNLDGKSGIEISDNDSFDVGSGPFTVEAWVKAKYVVQPDPGGGSSSSVNTIFSFGGTVAGAGTGGLVTTNTNKIGGYINQNLIDADSAFVEGKWYHVALRRNSSGLCTLFIDGEQQADQVTQGANITNTDTKTIGKDTNVTRNYQDLIDDFRLYNRLLSTKEIRRNFQATRGKHKN